MNSKAGSSNRQIARAAGTVMAAFIISQLLGLVRQILVTRAFGTGMEIDAFNASSRVSETLFNLVAGGALASAFIPTFTGLLTREKQKKAWRLASHTGNIIFLVVSVLALTAVIFAPSVVKHLLAPGFSTDPIKEQLTIDLLRLILPSAVIFSISGLVMGILNSHQVFFIPALTPAVYQLGIIFGVLVLSPLYGIFGLAWGVLSGSAMHLLLQIPALLKLKGRYIKGLGLEMPEVRQVGRLLAPRLLGVAVVQLNFWINIRIASNLPEGSVTGIVIAFVLMMMPQAAIAQSIAIAAMPTFSAQLANGKLAEFKESLTKSLLGVLMLALPASVGLIILRVPLVSILYQRGAFDEHSTQLVAWALLFYGIGLASHSIVEVISRAFYAFHDTKTPVMIGSIAMALNIGLSFLFSYLFSQAGLMPLGGIALANTVATTLEMIALLIAMRIRTGKLGDLRTSGSLLKIILASIVMAGVLLFWMSSTPATALWIRVIGGVMIGFISYITIVYLLRLSELGDMIKLVMKR